jgi:hypothetical protein
LTLSAIAMYSIQPNFVLVHACNSNIYNKHLKLVPFSFHVQKVE